MPTPTAQLRVSVNGGAATSGDVTAPSGATLQFSAVSTVGWTQQRWEIYDYPEGWATPSGWTLAGSGVIFSTALSPTLITLPSNSVTWGAWMPRLRINEQVNNDVTVIAGLQDTATKITMLSPHGQYDVGGLEATQACTSTTLLKGWVRTLQRNARVVEAGLGGGGGSGVPGGADGNVQTKSGTGFAGVSQVSIVSNFLTLTNNLKMTNSGFTLQVSPGTLTANRTLTFPDITDTIVTKTSTDTLTNKTLDIAGTGNNLTVASGATGDLPIYSGGKFGRFAKGTASQILAVKGDASTLEYTALLNAHVSASAAIAVSKLAAGTNGFILTTVAGVPTWAAPGGGGGGTPGGADRSVQFDNAGVFDGSTKVAIAASGDLTVGGTNPASTGAVRLPYQQAIAARNRTNAGDKYVCTSDTLSGANALFIGIDSAFTSALAYDYISVAANTQIEFTADLANKSVVLTSSDLALVNHKNFALLDAPGSQTYGGGLGVAFLANANTLPTTNPTAGIVLYIESGVLKYRKPSGQIVILDGSVTLNKAANYTFANSEPHVTVTTSGKTIKLPATGLVDGEQHTVKSGGAFTTIIDGNGTNIDGSATYTQGTNRECTRVRYNAVTPEWELVSKFV